MVTQNTKSIASIYKDISYAQTWKHLKSINTQNITRRFEPTTVLVYSQK